MNKKGFTLIELLIVVAIIGLLATLAILSLTAAQSKARDTKRVADLQSLRNGVEEYANDYAAYPQPVVRAGAVGGWNGTGNSLQTLLVGTGYLNGLPAVPGGGVTSDQYTYVSSALGANYCLLTTLEKTNQVLNQDKDTASCGLTVAFTANSGDTASTPLTAQTNCTDASFGLCLGSSGI